MSDRKPQMRTTPHIPEIDVERLPLKVVPDWDEQVRRANGICRLIDRHLCGLAQ